MAETAQCFSTHHVALLVGYGAHAISPYLAFETCRQWRASSRSAISTYFVLASCHQQLSLSDASVLFNVRRLREHHVVIHQICKKRHAHCHCLFSVLVKPLQSCL